MKDSKEGQYFKMVDVGPLSQINQYKFKNPVFSREIVGKIFLKQMLGLSSCEISINQLPPKTSWPFYHSHQQNEEIYIFLSGEGEFQVNDKVFPIKEGSFVRVDQPGERCWRNTSKTDNLTYIVIQARAGSLDSDTIEDGVGIQRRVSWIKKENA